MILFSVLLNKKYNSFSILCRRIDVRGEGKIVLERKSFISCVVTPLLNSSLENTRDETVSNEGNNMKFIKR